VEKFGAKQAVYVSALQRFCAGVRQMFSELELDLELEG